LVLKKKKSRKKLSKRHCLIDADSLVYRVGFTTEHVDEAIAFWRMNDCIKRILSATNAETYVCYITSSDKSNFRYSVDPEYKSNRVAPKPLHYTALRDYLINSHAAEVCFGIEADDALGINNGPDVILSHLDKDINMVPGLHYNWVKEEIYEVTEEQGLTSFYSQILTGDTADGIRGLKGIGPVKAAKLLGNSVGTILHKEEVYFRIALTAYKREFENDGLAQLTKTARLLKIRQHKDEPLWEPKKEWLTSETSTDPVLSETSLDS
jgi:5'-3' exonuclease